MAENRNHGYDAIFEPEVDKKYTCPVCLAVLRDAVQTHCGHRFCEVCITNVIGTRRAARCPVDNTWFYCDGQLFEDIAIRREILSFAVKCYYFNEGCEWKGELRDYEEHIEECIYRPVECTHQCGASVLYLNLSEHLDICPRRPTICAHCQENIIHVDMTKHQLLFCQKFPVSCTLCGKTGILRENIPTHVDTKTGDCPNTTILCCFQSVGCHFMDRRGLMSNHYSENMEEHLSLILSSGMEMYKQMAGGRREIAKLREEMEPLQILVLSQKYKLEEQSQYLNSSRNENRRGCVHWTIPESDSDEDITSPFVYTSTPGYKINFALSFNAQSLGFNSSHTYLIAYIHNREDEEQIDFPVQIKYKITLYDQLSPKFSRSNFTSTIECDYERVPTNHLISYEVCGTKKLLPTTSLFSSHYKKNRQIFMKIEEC
ncbi:hypothetical protein LOTGIDRAFT_154170 [Lottia gigantea]|uniref:Uncharacterized protein n=1 Tax=Lottia gigantea TaxID=225164 RepID=V4A2C8_LOTGI|nr:hypothetical protein LOTGIDRAFT_154170 [Lottia gigantea]ESO89090.1 hypothetical protein LOTGIDRAFT_154170 [Lottia gigantea]